MKLRMNLLFEECESEVLKYQKIQSFGRNQCGNKLSALSVYHWCKEKGVDMISFSHCTLSCGSFVSLCKTYQTTKKQLEDFFSLLQLFGWSVQGEVLSEDGLSFCTSVEETVALCEALSHRNFDNATCLHVYKSRFQEDLEAFQKRAVLSQKEWDFLFGLYESIGIFFGGYFAVSTRVQEVFFTVVSGEQDAFDAWITWEVLIKAYYFKRILQSFG